MNIELGKYKHKKGGMYEVVFVGMTLDCFEEMVVYKSLQESDDYPKGTIWVRSMTEFMTPGRFEKVNYDISK